MSRQPRSVRFSLDLPVVDTITENNISRPIGIRDDQKELDSPRKEEKYRQLLKERSYRNLLRKYAENKEKYNRLQSRYNKCKCIIGKEQDTLQRLYVDKEHSKRIRRKVRETRRVTRSMSREWNLEEDVIREKIQTVTESIEELQLYSMELSERLEFNKSDFQAITNAYYNWGV